MSDERESADVFDFVDAYLSALQRGQDLPLAHWLSRFPRSQDAIAREYLILKHPSVEAAQGAGASPPAFARADARRVGPYRILRELGRGGQGTVFLAEDSRIARRVALKVLAQSFESIAEEKLKRFRREADVIARLEHPGLCTIYDADIDGSTPWIAMRYVEGRTLAEIVADAKRAPAEVIFGLRLPPHNALETHAVLLVFERAARALHAAHEAGVVHRDVKPQNVLLALDGRPVLLDFGLARDDSSEPGSITQSGDVFGTPAYMSPEQLALKSDDLDRRTDVYSLGVALFEALTLVRPFERESRTALYKAISDDPPPDARKLNPALTEDVKVVLETALEKERHRRYATALDLAEDLRRIREYEPIHARSASVALRFARWVRRHPVLAVLTIGTIAALSIGLSITLSLLASERQALEYAVGQYLAQRSVALVPEDPSAALAVGIEGVERAPSYVTRSTLFQALDACWLRSDIAPATDSDDVSTRFVNDIATSPSSDLGVAGFSDGTATVIDLVSGKQIARLIGHSAAIQRVAFTQNGDRIVTAARDSTARVWNARTAELLRTIECPAGLSTATISSDGRFIALIAPNARIEIRDVESGARVSELEPGEFERVEFSPHGELVLASPPQPVAGAVDAPPKRAHVVFDVPSGRRVRAFEDVTCARFGVKRESILIASSDKTVRAVDHDGNVAGPVLVLDSAPTSIATSADGSRVAVIANHEAEAAVYLCDVASGSVMRLLGGTGRRISQAVFSPDGTRLATSSHDTTIRVWDAKNGRELRRFSLPWQHQDVAWSHDGTRLFSRSKGSRAHVWYAVARPDTFDLEGHTGAVRSASFRADGRVALTASDDGTARLWHIPSKADTGGGRTPGQLIAVMQHAGPLLRADLSADGGTVLTLCADGSAGVFESDAGNPRRASVRVPCAIVNGAIDARGEHVVLLGQDGIARFFDARSEAPPVSLANVGESRATPLCARFSDDGTLLAIGCADGTVRVRDAKSGALLRTISTAADRPGAQTFVDLDFRHGTDEIAVACGDQRLRFWHALDGSVARKEIFAFVLKSATFSRDGSRLLVTSLNKGGATVQSIDVATGLALRPRNAHTDDITSAAYNADGSLVLTTSKDGSAYVWSWTAKDETGNGVWSVSGGPPVVHRTDFGAVVLCGGFGADGDALRVITGCQNGRVCVWPVDPLPAARARRPRELYKWEKDREHDLALPLRYP